MHIRIFCLGLCIALPVTLSNAQTMPAPIGERTALGSDPNGNSAGSIPPWTGGITEPPRGYRQGGDYIDPFKADKPIATITARNMGQYRNQLSALHQALLKKFPDSYKMQLYPTRRSCSLPTRIYEAQRQNARTARLINDGNSVTNTTQGIPFPNARTPLEIYWNHNLHYRGEYFTGTVTMGNVYPDGRRDLSNINDTRLMLYSLPTTRNFEQLKNIQTKWRRVWTTPAARSGMAMSADNTIDQIAQPRPGFFYDPAQRKVRRAPPNGTVYNAPINTSSGMRLSDDFFLFNGAPDRYSWKLLGKREIIIPYNIYQIARSDGDLDALLTAGHLSQDNMRYELHRVWVVEITLKPQYTHEYHRRVLYFDEDSWVLTISDIYDKTGKLIRGQVGFIKNYYDLPACVQDFDVMYNLLDGRYGVDHLKQGHAPPDLKRAIPLSAFGANALRRLGR